MPSYFQNMSTIGSPLTAANAENEAELRKIEEELSKEAQEILASGRTDESLNKAGQLTAMQRLEKLVDKGSWFPLNSLYNPGNNADGSTGVITGLGKIHDKWAVIIASDNKKLAGAWVAGQALKLTRATDMAKQLNIPLVYVLNCSGVKLDEQEKVLCRQGNRRHAFLPSFRPYAVRHSRNSRYLRHKPRRRRLSRHQPHHTDCP
jgi:glutaconyl-CoA decarboxylase